MPPNSTHVSVILTFNRFTKAREPFSQAMLDELETRKSALFVFGRLAYEDVFQKCHWLDFCANYNKDTDTYNACDYYNDTGETSTPPPCK